MQETNETTVKEKRTRIKRRKSKEEKAITIIALIVTIIVMLILAGVTISIAMGDNGIIKRAKESGRRYQEAAINETNQLGELDESISTLGEGTGSGEATVKLTGKDGSTIKLKANMTQEELQGVYGKTVEYGTDTSITWRIFYIDHEGRYGDAGTVYLKADPIKSYYLDSSHGNAETPKTFSSKDSDPNSNTKNKIWQMNPAYASLSTVNSDFSKVSSNTNAQGVAWLMDPTKWTKYLDTSKADYVIGSPSIEMYCDSIATYKSAFARGSSTSNASTLKDGWKEVNETGYNVTSYRKGMLWQNSSSYNSSNLADQMYCPNNKFWWLGSPSSSNASDVRNVLGNYCFFGDNLVSGGSVCPLVSLNTKI